jgi:hypothetical protein
MDKSMRAKFLLKSFVFCFLVIGCAAGGYFLAWHRALSREYSATELTVDLNIHYLSRLHEIGQLDKSVEREMSEMVQAQLGFLMETKSLQEKTFIWALINPGDFLKLSQEVRRPRSVEDSLRAAQAVGINLTPLRDFPGFPKQSL